MVYVQLDVIYNKSCERMDEIDDEQVHLVVTSPPYNVGKEYEENLSIDEYLDFADRIMSEIRRVLVVGGRVCINVGNTGRQPYVPLATYWNNIAMKHNFLFRGEIIWHKGAGARKTTAWGSWRYQSNPYLRDYHEYILVYSKDTLYLDEKYNYNKVKEELTREEFLQYTESVWDVLPEQAKRVGHPAPFPVEIPYRLIKLYSYQGNVVLDPFMGSGTTAIAAIRLKRHFIGYEKEEKYCKIAEQRIMLEKSNILT